MNPGKTRIAGIVRFLAISLVTLAVILFVTVKAIYWNVHRTDISVEPSSPANLDTPRIDIPVEPSSPADLDTPRTLPIPPDLLAALQTPADFQLRYKVSDIPVPVKVAFAQAAHLDAFTMAELGARWEATDVIMWPYLPRRRLIAAAFTDSFWLIFYELGGRAISRSVAVFRLSPAAVEPVGRLNIAPGIADPASLSRVVDSETTLNLRYF